VQIRISRGAKTIQSFILLLYFTSRGRAISQNPVCAQIANTQEQTYEEKNKTWAKKVIFLHCSIIISFTVHKIQYYSYLQLCRLDPVAMAQKWHHTISEYLSRFYCIYLSPRTNWHWTNPVVYLVPIPRIFYEGT